MSAIGLQILLALIGQMPTIVQLVEKLVAEKRDATPEEVAALKQSAPIVHMMLMATQAKAACPCGAIQPIGVMP